MQTTKHQTNRFTFVPPLVVLLCAAGMAGAGITGNLSPGSSVIRPAGQPNTYTLDYSINITGGGSNKADVLFLTDTTGSMYSYINGVKSAYSSIYNAIGAAHPDLDIQYAVSDYKDYTDGGYYRSNGVNLRQSFTSDQTAIQNAIDSMTARGGADLPEAQFKAMRNISDNWLSAADSGPLGFGGRSDAQKILVWAGDYQGHIQGDVASGNPAADYYPTMQETLDSLNEQGIVTFALNTKGETYSWGLNGRNDSTPTGQGQADYITSGTGGEAFHDVGTGGATVENAIVDAINGGIENLSNITISMDGYDGDWTIDSTSHTYIGSWAPGSTVTGSYTFDATPGLSLGSDSVTFNLLGNGGYLDSATINLSTSAVPTPSAFILCLIGLGIARKRRLSA